MELNSIDFLINKLNNAIMLQCNDFSQLNQGSIWVNWVFKAYILENLSNFFKL